MSKLRKGSVVVARFAKHQTNGKFPTSSGDQVTCMPCKNQKSKIAEYRETGSTWEVEIIGISKKRKNLRYRVRLIEMTSKTPGIICTIGDSGAKKAPSSERRYVRKPQPAYAG